jgi:outer membrane protein OmpA-like peptidoglycan-associated protein
MMHPIKTLSLLLTLTIAATAIGQTDDKNQVKNPGFEEVQPGLRRNGQFDLVTDWSSPTSHIADIFSANAKSKTVALPDNMYGTQSPFEGDNYAGIVALSPRNKIPRTYLQVSLKQKMVAKNLYCVRYRASLAERSRFAANNLGALLEKSEINEKTAITLDRGSALYPDLNDAVTERDGWWEFCQVYAAKGGEAYLIIGNFSTEDRTITQSMEIPKAFEEAGGLQAAYYYIDGVEVERINAGESCNCPGSRIPESKIIFSGSPEIKDDMSLKQKLEAIQVYFYQYKGDLVSAAERTTDMVAELLKANPRAKVLITGHSDNEEIALAEKESAVKNLAEKRARNVKAYLESQGIEPERITVKSADNKEPAAQGTAPVALAKNRRVTFKLVP